ncbi:hypothetical protein F383_35732 [Gossypium arboreum]|uniref:Uncharacterized protein n=1 Tax=Gossypium arboreum TaxID=29729 RepID=A0A0B0PXW9_GOSAR|nr:hypothetical protein F383_35732 [Gossypium arboreum]
MPSDLSPVIIRIIMHKALIYHYHFRLNNHIQRAWF